jgi:Fe-S-cluster containining protein
MASRSLHWAEQMKIDELEALAAEMGVQDLLLKPSEYCRFLDEEYRCSIYEARMSSCRAFPLGVVRGRDGNISLQWFGDQCNITSDESIFWKLVDNAILNWNEGVKNQLLLMNAQDQLRDMGFGKYLGDNR